MEYLGVWLDWVVTYLFLDGSHELSLPQLVVVETVLPLSDAFLLDFTMLVIIQGDYWELREKIS